MNGQIAPVNASAETSLEDLAAAANKWHERIIGCLRKTIYAAKQAGDALVAAKARMQHGEWLPWLKANFNGSPETARVYMRISKGWEHLVEFVEKSPNLSIEGARDILRPEQDKDCIRLRNFPTEISVLRKYLAKDFANAFDWLPEVLVPIFFEKREEIWGVIFEHLGVESVATTDLPPTLYFKQLKAIGNGTNQQAADGGEDWE